ncbi:hypothetical protein AAMO2058_000231600 [Amorphochlora amoebiformis]
MVIISLYSDVHEIINIFFGMVIICLYADVHEIINIIFGMVIISLYADVHEIINIIFGMVIISLYADVHEIINIIFGMVIISLYADDIWRLMTQQLLKALLQFAKDCRAHKSWWPNGQWFRRQSFDFARHAHPIRDALTRSHVPPNLFLCAGGPELRQVLSRSNWGDACYALRKSMEAELYDPEIPEISGPGIPPTSPGILGPARGASALRQWVLFFDTDHEIHTPHARLALGCAERLIIPMSLDENDYDRLFIEEIALFPVLNKLNDQGVLKAKMYRTTMVFHFFCRVRLCYTSIIMLRLLDQQVCSQREYKNFSENSGEQRGMTLRLDI